jgi:hypothetical protein
MRIKEEKTNENARDVSMSGYQKKKRLQLHQVINYNLQEQCKWIGRYLKID